MDPIQDPRLEYLLDRYVQNAISSAERQELLEMIRQGGRDEAIKGWMERSTGRLVEGYRLDEEDSQRMLAAILATEFAPARVVRMERERHGFLRRRIAWAAAVLLLVAGGTALFLYNHRAGDVATAQPKKVFKGDVDPGHSGAVLQLADGRRVALDSAANGAVARQGGVVAVKSNGSLIYKGEAAEIVYNTVSTDRGRQWQLVLPDGTRVWLNAASSIRYPTAFTGASREVEMTGEAYFEVVHNARQPFHVRVAGRVIEDIGTAFNVNAYSDEPVMRTTLIGGAVRIGEVRLRPGQEADSKGAQTRVRTGHPEQALAWKNGLFSFDHADIYTVMRQLSRWYNVDVRFEGKPDNAPFEGEIGRGLTLAQVLKGLEQVHVHFRIEEDKRIVILP